MSKKHLATLFSLTGTILISTTLHAADLGEGLANDSSAILLKNQSNNYTHWNGIGKIYWNSDPRCTASLLDTRDKDNKAVGPAYLLSAAHCVPGVIGMTDTSTKESVKFNYFNDTSHAYRTYTIKETVWKNFDHTDLAIMELDVALATLLEEGITPLQLASERSDSLSDVLVVGAPHRLPESGLRLAACAQEPTAAPLVEGDKVFLSTAKNRCREIRPGSSGSPVLDRKNGHILGVLSTSTYGATMDEKCFDNAPCEVKNGQPEWSADTHYSHPVAHLSGCFSAGRFTRVANACSSDSTFKVTDLKYWPTQYVAMPRDVTSPDPVINAQFSLNTPFYRFKTVRDVIECRSPRHYSGTVEATDAVINTPISREPGMYFLCVIGVDSSEQRPSVQLMENAWITPVQLIERTPVRMPEPTITLSAEWNYTVNWRYLVPTHFGTLYYAGPTNATDCSKVEIDDYIDTFGAVHFKAEQLPLTLCSRNRDLTRRYSNVRTDLLALP